VTALSVAGTKLARMTDMTDPKTALHHYLQDARDALVWKLDGVDERNARLPRTATGNNLLGLLKHCTNVEAVYFGPVFGREFPQSNELVPFAAYDDDPQTDWFATEAETKDGLIDLYRRVRAFADETIEELPLDATGHVPWWGPGRQDVTLHLIILHVASELARHAGQADIMREQLDEVTGMRAGDGSVPADYDWPAYIAKLAELADRFAPDVGLRSNRDQVQIT